MLILRGSPTSPFVRIISLAGHVLGLMGDGKMRIEPANTDDADDTLRKQNPLGKIPTLVADGKAIYDTKVILSYLDGRFGGGGGSEASPSASRNHNNSKLMPKGDAARLDCLIGYALATGMLDAAILIVYESRFRDEAMRSEKFTEYQREKITRGLARLAEEGAGYKGGAVPNIRDIAVGVTLDYLDLRRPVDWRDHCPEYMGFMRDFAKSVPGYKQTLPPDIPAADWR